MKAMRLKGYGMSVLCDYEGITCQAYHQRLADQQKKAEIYDKAEEIVIANRAKRSRAGLRAIYHKEQLGTLLGLNSFEREMSYRGYALKPYRSYLKTTDSTGHYNKFANKIKGKPIRAENQAIVGDITYYKNQSGLYYIFQFRDYYTLEVKGLIGSRTLEGKNAEKCLSQVFRYNNKRKYAHKLILHTDRGSQYRSKRFMGMIKKAQIRPSYAENCLENGLSERTNGTVKNEYLVDYEVKNLNHLNAILKRIQHQINEEWPSKTLGYLTPKEYAEQMRKLKTKQRPVKTVKVVELK